MSTRPMLNKAVPAAYKTTIALSEQAEKAALDAGVEPLAIELVRIRASQINGCGFCLDMHTRDARKLGVSDQKLDVLAAWTEAGDLFTAREQAALALTEALTVLGDHGVPEDVYAVAADAFTQRELGQVIAMAVTINAWNRINAAVQTPPPRR